MGNGCHARWGKVSRAMGEGCRARGGKGYRMRWGKGVSQDGEKCVARWGERVLRMGERVARVREGCHAQVEGCCAMGGKGAGRWGDGCRAMGGGGGSQADERTRLTEGALLVLRLEVHYLRWQAQVLFACNKEIISDEHSVMTRRTRQTKCQVEMTYLVDTGHASTFPACGTAREMDGNSYSPCLVR